MKKLTKTQRAEINTWLIKKSKQAFNANNINDARIYAMLSEITKDHKRLEDIIQTLKKEFNNDIKFRLAVTPRKCRTIRLKKGEYYA